ncbi:C-C motif chemokine 3-like [Liasis olivaceus]
MKAVLTFLLLVVSIALAAGGPNPATELTQPKDQYGEPWPRYCCFDFTDRPLPLKILKSFYYTNSNCSKPGVIFITKQNREICADPSEKWVQDRIRDLSPP